MKGGCLLFDTVNFMVRSSGRFMGKCYIDYKGMYKLADIARETKLPEETLRDIYGRTGGVFDEAMGVYYFEGSAGAKEAVTLVLEKLGVGVKGRAVLLTEREIDVIRRALISDGAVPFGIEAKAKDSILKKLNG